jgi:eukaryotic-like serine/threonine-protein kinase
MTPTTTSTCPSCGGAVLPGDRFCGSCGTSIAPLNRPASATGPQSSVSSPAPVSPSLATAAGLVADTSPWAAVAARLQSATLGEFEIMTELGRGGMAAVYLARDLALNRRVAIKVMAPGLLLGPGMVERFRQEAVTVANLQHAHIVSIHAVRQLEDLHFFVMQFVPGRTLEGVLREGHTLAIPVIRAWLYQIGSALGYAHRRGVIHRDIKPGNILLNADGEAIVTDFGIAKVAESPSHTQTGTVVGTPVYMSPEQCYAKELTGASDQYSLGVVAYEMLAGRPPFTGSSFALMRAHTDEPPPPLRDVRPDVPPSMEAALMRMLAKRPDERFATLAEALVSLGASPIAPDDPLHATLARLAAASERLEQLGDVLRTPASPVPKTRERPVPAVRTPPATAPAPALVVVIAPPPSDLEPGATAALRATLRNATGQTVPAVQLAWSSSKPDVVTVDARTGVLHAVAAGEATITAAAGAAHDTVDVVIGEPRPATIAVSVPPAGVRTGEQVTASAVVTSRYGVRVSRPVEWSVDEAAVAAVDRTSASGGTASATLRALTPGTAGVIAVCEGAVGRATLRVLPAPVAAPPPLATPAVEAARSSAPPPSATAVLSPAPPSEAPPAAKPPVAVPRRDGDAPARPAAAPAPNPVAATPSTRTKGAKDASGAAAGGIWRWAVPAVAAVGVVAYLALRPSPSVQESPADTTVIPRDSTPAATVDPAVARRDSASRAAESTAVAARPADTASAPRRDSATSVTSATTRPPAVPSRIEIRPARPPAISQGQSVALAATVRDTSGAAIAGARVTWTSADPRVATVDPVRGVVRGVGAGATRITARDGAVTATLTVSVAPPAVDPAIVASVDIADVRPLTVGESARVTASARNAAGDPAPGAAIEWSSSNPSVASITQEGMLTARGAGSATIRASAGGRTADRAVTVRAREVASRPDTPAAPPPSAPTVKSEAELRTEILAVVATYTRAIQTRDTSLIRRVFPNAGSELMSRWQATFNDARGNIQVTGAAPQILDTPRDAAGAQVRARVKNSARFSPKAGRSEQSFPVEFTATLQRDGGTWRITRIE